MNLGVKIINSLSILIAFFVAIRLDGLIAKWVAYFMIAWENAASNNARKIYDENVMVFRKEVNKNKGIWDQWRKEKMHEPEK